MNSEKKEKPRMLAATEEVDKISRSMRVWANTFPEKPVDIIKYEFLSADQGDETGMALSTIQGTYITKRFILGGYQAEYQFKLIYRIKPGRSNDKRLEADELLFQSTHPARGATVCRRATMDVFTCFNPRTPRGVRPRRSAKPSWPLPFQSTHPARGATEIGFDDFTYAFYVSIHAPREGCDGKPVLTLPGM